MARRRRLRRRDRGLAPRRAGRSSTGTTARARPATASSSSITRELSAWLEETFSVKSYRPPYFIESTGIFLKDSAVLAGLGCIGRNNMVVTPGVRSSHPLAGAAPGPHGEGHRPGRLRPLRRLPAAVPQGLPRQGVRPRRLLTDRARAVASAGHQRDLRPGDLQHQDVAGRRGRRRGRWRRAMKKAMPWPRR